MKCNQLTEAHLRCEHDALPGNIWCSSHKPGRVGIRITPDTHVPSLAFGFEPPLRAPIAYTATLVPGHFDTPPSGAITAEQVRAFKRKRWLLRWLIPFGVDRVTLTGLLTHPGVSSAARAVIEAALE